MFKALGAFKAYQDTAVRKRESLELVTSFYQCTLAKKALKELQGSSDAKRRHRADAVACIQLSYLHKLFHSVRLVTDQSKVYVAMQNPSQVRACQVWLQLSFSKVMGAVWVDFPKQEIKYDHETGDELSLQNYLQLSRRPRYHQFFFDANRTLRRRTQLRVLDALYYHALQRKQLIKRFYEARMGRVFRAFSKATRVQRALRCFVAEKDVADRAFLRAKAFKGLRRVVRK